MKAKSGFWAFTVHSIQAVDFANLFQLLLTGWYICVCTWEQNKFCFTFNGKTQL